MSVSLQRARDLFALVNSKICCPSSASAPCIPFLYPDDGCWGRAHEMCRLIIVEGEQPRKIWIQGSLTVASANKPTCAVQWGWHVAPTIEVTTGGSDQTYVIDPSLFNEPVPQAVWVGVQGDPNPTLTATGSDIFHEFYPPDRYDPTYAKTNSVLNAYRNDLKLRAASPDGHLPISHVRSSGRSAVGRHARTNATKRWYTWGWPASWHVFWTLMPVTPCPGGRNCVGRWGSNGRSANDCTYWITATNLTGDRVKIEGRYNRLG